MNLNFRTGKWWEVSLTFAWPHQWFQIGWLMEEPNDEDRSYLVRIYLGCISINIEWGDDNW